MINGDQLVFEFENACSTPFSRQISQIQVENKLKRTRLKTGEIT